jgi:hypothetical protein
MYGVCVLLCMYGVCVLLCMYGVCVCVCAVCGVCVAAAAVVCARTRRMLTLSISPLEKPAALAGLWRVWALVCVSLFLLHADLRVIIV